MIYTKMKENDQEDDPEPEGYTNQKEYRNERGEM